MKQTTERFQKAYDALIEAYFDGTLKKGQCYACAVGNICKKASEVTGINNRRWNYLFYTGDDNQNIWNPETHNLTSFADMFDGNYEEKLEIALTLIAETGYTWQELAQVEYTFETNAKINSSNYPDHTEQEILEDQYNGLVAVVEVLCRLDGIEDVQQRQDRFKEHPKLLMA